MVNCEAERPGKRENERRNHQPTSDAHNHDPDSAAGPVPSSREPAEARIAQLETDVVCYKEPAARADEWLNYISSEIEQNFLARLTAGGEASSRGKNGGQPAQKR